VYKECVVYKIYIACMYDCCVALFLKHTLHAAPPQGECLVAVVGLMGSEDPADSDFRNPKGRSLLESPTQI